MSILINWLRKMIIITLLIDKWILIQTIEELVLK